MQTLNIHRNKNELKLDTEDWRNRAIKGKDDKLNGVGSNWKQLGNISHQERHVRFDKS